MKCEQCGRTRPDDERQCVCGHYHDHSKDESLFDPASGKVGMDYSGDVTLGIGSGISIDLDDGGLNIGGISVDGD